MFPPTILEEEEINDPYLVLYRFFDYAGIDSQREHLWECLKTTAAGTFSTELLNRHKRYDLLYFFEHLAKLVEAAYLIHRQRMETKNKKPE